VLSDRRPSDALRRAAALMALGGVGFALMALGDTWPVVVGAMIAGISWGWQSPLSLAVVSAHPESPAAAVGIQMFGFFIGAIVGPLAVGALVENGAFSTAWALCAAATLMAAAVALFARRNLGSA
jgi:cyanate permease